MTSRPSRARRASLKPPATRTEALPPAPFLKWAGGKGQLVDAILPLLPERIETYYEPFVGGGAIFFALAHARRFERAVLSDRNPRLVEAYRVVRDRLRPMLVALRRHARRGNEEAYYYRIRGLTEERLGAAERVARLIYLNRTCYNGLYRVNSRGEFNVPFGRYRNPLIANEALLVSVREALRGVRIEADDFETLAGRARPGDAVYFDPPYFPVSKTSSFTAYDPNPFLEREHERLAGVFRRLEERGIAAVLSNSDTPFTRRLYEGLEVRTVAARRSINSVSTRRGAVSELLVVSRGSPRSREKGKRRG